MSIGAGPPDSSLTNVEHLAWRSLQTLLLLGLPEVERSFRRYGLVQVEYQALVELCDRPDGLRLGDLAAALQVSPSRLSHRMEKLTRAGLVRLDSVASDARGTAAVITHTGRALVDRLASGHEQDVRRMLFEPLQQQQVRALADALSTLAAALTAKGSGAVADVEGESEAPAPAPAQERRRWRDALRTRRP